MLERVGMPVEQSVVMPSKEVMIKRLETTLLPLKQQGVLFRFVSSVAEQEETGSSLVAAWEGACQEANRKFRQWKDQTITHLLHAYAFPGVIDTITPNRQVANAAKAELKFLEKIRT